MSDQLSPSAGVRKRQQIASTNKQMMIYVAAAAAVVTICIMLAINFVQRISFQMKVNAEWSATNESLKNSIASIPKLRENVEALSANSNIKSIQELADPTLEKWQVVFDVLPSSCDTMAVEYAFTHKIFQPAQLGAAVKDATATLTSGACDSITAVSTSTVDTTGAESTTASSGSAESTKPQPILMTVSFELTNATDEDIRKALLSMEFSLHPITVQNISIKVDDSNIRSAAITAVTYFVPKTDWETGEKTIPFNENAGSSSEEATE